MNQNSINIPQKVNKNNPIQTSLLTSKRKTSKDFHLNFQRLEKTNHLNKSFAQHKNKRDNDLILSDRNKGKYEDSEFRIELKRKRQRPKYTSQNGFYPYFSFKQPDSHRSWKNKDKKMSKSKNGLSLRAKNIEQKMNDIISTSHFQKPLLKSERKIGLQKASIKQIMKKMMSELKKNTRSYTTVNRKKKLKKKSNRALQNVILQQKNRGHKKRNSDVEKIKIIDKLASLKSMDPSIFTSQKESNKYLKNNSIFLNSDESKEYLKELKIFQSVQHSFHDQEEKMNEKQLKNTQELIQNYAFFSKRFFYDEDQNSNQQKYDQSKENRNSNTNINFLTPFPYEMQKQQKILNQLQRVKLNELKNYEMTKWAELLSYIKNCIEKGTMSSSQLLQEIYEFLKKAKNDLQQEIQERNEQKIQNKEPQQQDSQENLLQVQNINFEESMSEQNQSSVEEDSFHEENLKMMNFEAIDHALKQCYERLIQKREIQLELLEKKRKKEKINQLDYIWEKENIEKWINNEVNEIINARKSIWKGYMGAKEMLEKTVKSKHFQNNNQKKNVIKCLSENSLLKTNFRQLFTQKQVFEAFMLKQISSEEVQVTSEKLFGFDSNLLSCEGEQSEIEVDVSEEQESEKKGFQNALKNIELEQKQDIFEFIFLDLCVQMYEEPYKSNHILEKIQSFIKSLKHKTNMKKGMKTNLTTVKQYLNTFTSFILKTNKKILQTMNQPLGPSTLEMLRYMHNNDDDDSNESSSLKLVIPVSIFDEYENSFLESLKFQNYYEESEKQEKRLLFLKHISHIHNKAIFDTLNEYLDQMRPYGIWGKPFPWKSSSNFNHLSSDVVLESKLTKGINKTIEYCSYVCGLLSDKEESLVANISTTYLEQIRQDRLSKMLANQIHQNEEKWLFYDDEETQIMVEISNFITWTLIREVVFEFTLFNK